MELFLYLDHRQLCREKKHIRKQKPELELDDVADEFQSRLVFMGPATGGKTSLVKSLTNGSPQLTCTEDRTAVIDINSWNISNNCSYMIFDQGGHEIYSITNIFFISSESKNIICHDISMMDNDSVKKTLDFLTSTLHQCPESDIFFVLTKVDLVDYNSAVERKRQFEEMINSIYDHEIETLSNNNQTNNHNDLLNNFKRRQNRTKIFLVSNKTYDGIDDLKTYLTDLAMQNMLSCSKIWQKCYQMMQQSGKRYYKMSEFESTFKKANAPTNHIQKINSMLKKSKENPITCLKYFHNIGMVFWFSVNPVLKDYIFHDLHFLINVMKCVFHHDLQQHLDYETSKKVQAWFFHAEYQELVSNYQNEGLVSFKLLSCLLWDLNLTTEDVFAVLEVMKLFNICHEIDNTKGEHQLLFFPWLIQNNQVPEFIDPGNLSVVNRSSITLHLECLFNKSIPRNLTEMFIVCLQKHAVDNNYLGKRHAWKNGLLVEVGKIKCFVIRRPENSSLHLGIRGGVDELFEMWSAFCRLFSSLRKILEQWTGVLRSIHIQCPHCALMKVDPPYRWLTDKVFNRNDHNLSFSSCCKGSELDDSTHVPSAMITMIKAETQELMQYHKELVRQYLEKYDPEPKLINQGKCCQNLEPIVDLCADMTKLSLNETTPLETQKLNDIILQHDEEDIEEVFSHFIEKLESFDTPAFVQRTYLIDGFNKICIDVDKGHLEQSTQFFSEKFPQIHVENKFDILEQGQTKLITKPKLAALVDDVQNSQGAQGTSDNNMVSGNNGSNKQDPGKLHDYIESGSTIQVKDSGTVTAIAHDRNNHSNLYGLTVNHICSNRINEYVRGINVPSGCYIKSQTEPVLIGNDYYGLRSRSSDFGNLSLDVGRSSKDNKVTVMRLPVASYIENVVVDFAVIPLIEQVKPLVRTGYNSGDCQFQLYKDSDRNMQGKQVKILGSISGDQNGILFELKNVTNFKNGKPHKPDRSDLFTIVSERKELDEKFVVEGDSGSVVLCNPTNDQPTESPMCHAYGVIFSFQENYTMRHPFTKSRKLVWCLKLDTCLEEVKKKWDIELDIGPISVHRAGSSASSSVGTMTDSELQASASNLTTQSSTSTSKPHSLQHTQAFSHIM